MVALAIQPSERRGDPYVAAFLSWAIPGAGHVYLGMPVLGLIAFVVIEGLYVVGLRLSGGMLFEFLEPELRGPIAGVLTPEIGNLGMLVYHMRAFGFGPGEPRVWPPMMELGTWLTAISGILNVCWVARAQLDARTRRGTPPLRASPVREVVGGWFLPGLGHFLQGRRLRGAIVCGSLVGLFVLGTLLCEGSNLDRERHFYYWAGQFLLGAPAMVGELVHGDALVAHEIPYVDAGLGMVCVAGLLNVLAMIDVYTYWEQRELGPGSAPVDAPGVPVDTPRAGTLA